MQTQLRSVGSNWNLQIITLGIVVFLGVCQLGLGAAYIDAGSPYQAISLSSLFASDVGVKAVGGYLIVAGILLILLPVLVCYNLAKNKTNRTLSTLSWGVCCTMTMLIFTCSVLAAQQYNPTKKHASDLNVSLSSYGTKIRNCYNFALADTILTFIFGFLSTIYLVFAANYHRDRVQNQIEDQERDDHNVTNQSNYKDRGNHPPNRATPPKSIDLQRDNYNHPPGDAERRMGSMMYKEQPHNFNQNQNQPPPDPDAPHFNNPHPPQSPRSDLKRSKTQFSHSQPDFNVEMPRVSRGSYDGRREQPNSRRSPRIRP